jgi:serine/threonine protein kinase
VTICQTAGDQYGGLNGTTLLPEEDTGLQWETTTKSIHPYPVTNLSVEAQVYNRSRRLLQLAVSWIPPTAGIPPVDYNLHVKPDEEAGDCKTHPYYKHIDDRDATSVSVPEYVEGMSEMKITPGCTYEIVVEANPIDGKRKASLNYTVPDCVEDVCSCHHHKGLPKPTGVTAQPVVPRYVNTSWYLSPTAKSDKGYAVNVTKFIVSFGHHVHRQRFNMTLARDLNYSHRTDVTSHHSLLIETPSDLTANMTYMVKVLVVDNRGCQGPASNYTFKLPDQSTEPNQTVVVVGHASLQWTVVVTVLFFSSFLMVIIFTLVVIWQRPGRCIHWKLGESRLQPIHSWHGVYKAVSNDSGVTRLSRNFPSLQARNIIYVEKEIEEAKARGDADTFEVSHDRLELGRQIGKGAFGRVFVARAEAIVGIPGYSTVAVKKLKNKASSDELEEFLSEIAMMKRVGRHPNVVTMLGCCTLKQPYYMIMEYVPCGDLLHYLRQLRVEYEHCVEGAQAAYNTTQGFCPRYIGDQIHLSDSSASYVQPNIQMSGSTQQTSITHTVWSMLTSDGPPLTQMDLPPRQKLEYILDPKELQNFAVQIARGMVHLEQKQITHRDLAARNVLINERKILKISDFGLSRSGVYVNTKHKKVPLRWLSVEAMRENFYSSKSDVWAFGIVLWEIGTLGGFPYPTVSDMDLLNFLDEGKRLEKPDNCSEELYTLMLQCWSKTPDMRPSFAEIVSHLDSVICRKRVYVDFSSLKPNYSFPPTEQQTDLLTNSKQSK